MSGIMKVMTTGKFPHLQVVEDGQLVGIVSIGDVVKHRVLESNSNPLLCEIYIRTV
jgi:signal-transduction protein with cAMP-binding, CBS, and nucleotidyltransferase domain